MPMSYLQPFSKDLNLEKQIMLDYHFVFVYIGLLSDLRKELNPKWLNPLRQKNDPKISSHQAQKIEMSSYSRVCWVVSLLFRTNTLFPSNRQRWDALKINDFRKKHYLPTSIGKVSIRNREFGDGSFLGLNIINFSYFPGMPWRPLRNIRK